MSKHKHYDLLNLIGYGLAKFNLPFVQALGFDNKTDFYQSVVEKGFAESVSVVKNRQDLFDPFFKNGRKGWWQKGDTYKHRKVSIDALYKDLSNQQFADVVNFLLNPELVKLAETSLQSSPITPITSSKFKKLQETGYIAEHYFMTHFEKIPEFKNGLLTDARFLGDGYDFQIDLSKKFLLAEIKGVRGKSGGVRLTHNEYKKAQEFKSDYGLIIISNLNETPKITPVFNPIYKLSMTKTELQTTNVMYQVASQNW